MGQGVDLSALCIYPVIDRPDWDTLVSFSNCGMYQIYGQKNSIADKNYIKAIILCKHQMVVEQQSYKKRGLMNASM